MDIPSPGGIMRQGVDVALRYRRTSHDRVGVTVTRDATLAGAARLMARGDLKRLPVVDGDGRLLIRVAGRPESWTSRFD